jgi:hypothetical protein
MHGLTFDRLSKALVIGGVALIALGVVVAFFKSHRAHDPDGAMFWICGIVTLLALALFVVLAGNEANVRAFGLCFPLSTEDRLNGLEDRAAKIEAKHAEEVAALRRTIQDNQQNASDLHRDEVAAITGVRQLVIELQTDGLPLALFSLFWLFIGAVLTSIPDLMAGWIKHLHP